MPPAAGNGTPGRHWGPRADPGWRSKQLSTRTSPWRYGFSAYGMPPEHFRTKALDLWNRGFRALEVFAVGDAVTPEVFGRYTEAIGGVRDETGFAISVHLPTTDCNPLARNRRVARGAVDSQRAGLEWAGSLGAKLAVLHLGSATARPAQPAGPSGPEYFGRSWEQARAVLRELAEAADVAGVTLTVENLIGPSELATRPAHMLELLDHPDLEGVGLTVDLSHAQLSGWDPAEFLRIVAPRLRHVHANDTDGQGDRHWPLGRGQLALGPVMAELRRLGFAGTLLLEVDAPPEELDHNRGLCEALAAEA